MFPEVSVVPENVFGGASIYGVVDCPRFRSVSPFANGHLLPFVECDAFPFVCPKRVCHGNFVLIGIHVVNCCGLSFLGREAKSFADVYVSFVVFVEVPCVWWQVHVMKCHRVVVIGEYFDWSVVDNMGSVLGATPVCILVIGVLCIFVAGCSGRSVFSSVWFGCCLMRCVLVGGSVMIWILGS